MKRMPPMELFQIIEESDIIVFGKIVDTLENYYLVDVEESKKATCATQIQVYFHIGKERGGAKLIGEEVLLFLRESKDSYSAYDHVANSVLFKKPKGYSLKYYGGTFVSKEDFTKGIDLYFKAYKKDKKTIKYHQLMSDRAINKMAKENPLMKIIKRNIKYYLVEKK